MDLLQRELARKKSVLQQAASIENENSTTRKKRKYLKQSEIRRLEEEAEEEAARQLLLQKETPQQAKVVAVPAEKRMKKSLSEDVVSNHHLEDKGRSTKKKQQKKSKKDEQHGQEVKSHEADKDNETNLSSTTAESMGSSLLSKEELIAKLRLFGLPICFFGESFSEQQERLHAALSQQQQQLQGLSEMEEYRLGQGHGIRNPFLEKDAQDKPAAPQNGEEIGENKEEEPEEEEEDTSNDPAKKVYKFLKGLLKDWEAELEARPASIAKTVAGRNEAKTLKQCKDYIRPLFKQLKRRTIEPGMQAHLVKIVDFAKEGEFVRAHDAYLDVAIGRAAWPIGVTMVGIHARSGRAKIESSNVAHVMNSELQRKYLTSVKRLLSYAQKKRTDVDPSKKVS